MGGSIKRPGILGVVAVLFLGIGHVSDVGGAYQTFASIKAIFVTPASGPTPSPQFTAAPREPATVQPIDKDTLMSMEGVRGALHKKKSATILRQISGRSYCGDGFSMRFRDNGHGFYLDATYMTGGASYNKTTEIKIQGYSDQYDAVMYFNPILDEPRMVAVRANGDRINDMTYYTEQRVDSFTKELCDVERISE